MNKDKELEIRHWFSGKKLFKSTKKNNSLATCIREANRRGVKLYGADLRGVDLSGGDLSGLNLSGVKLNSSNLSKTNFCGSNLRKACLYGANLEGANFSGANMVKSDIRKTNIVNTNFEGADLSFALKDEELAEYPSFEKQHLVLYTSILIATLGIIYTIIRLIFF